MDSQQQQSAMVLYIPYTYGENNGRKGVTEKQVFWHMRNLNIGFIDHIDCKERTDKNGVHIRSWFVHFSTWTAPADATEQLNSGGHLEITYDDYGHYWKLFKYTPTVRNNSKKEFKIRVVSKEGKPIKNPFAALPIEGEDDAPLEQTASPRNENDSRRPSGLWIGETESPIDENDFPTLTSQDTSDTPPTLKQWPATATLESATLESA